uniref:Cordon-bleu WH2 repeat protein-like 1a n=1 Tax=Cyprinus carpio TaxID=7962 RepID=A0A8C2JI25_CYPCA
MVFQLNDPSVYLFFFFLLHQYENQNLQCHLSFILATEHTNGSQRRSHGQGHNSDCTAPSRTGDHSHSAWKVSERETIKVILHIFTNSGHILIHLCVCACSKPVMDVLVTLCARHHLVPSDHVIKLISTNQNHINFKPNYMIGSLEFERVVLQTKGSDNKKKPHVPVATVRLLINYKKSHKAVVRVNPTVPLAELMPTVCEKCEFNRDTTIFLRTYQSEEPLDLTQTLNDFGIRELYAKDIKGGDEEQKSLVKEKTHREKGNKGFFGLFKKNKKTPEQAVTGSAPISLERNGQCADRVNGVNGHLTLPMVTADMPKKRRAPQPPLTVSQSVTCGLHTRDFSNLSESNSAGKQGQLSRISSTESSLKRTKRRAPPPPCDGPTPSESDNKVEEAQGDVKSSDKYRACIADHCPAIAKVMSELAESLQARQQRTLSSVNSSISQNQLAEDSSTETSAEQAVF